jgi:outer membrane protein
LNQTGVSSERLDERRAFSGKPTGYPSLIVVPANANVANADCKTTILGDLVSLVLAACWLKLPQYDPAISGLVNWAHQSTPEFSPLITDGSNWLVTNSPSGNVGFTQGFSPGTQISVTFDNTRLTSNSERYTYNPILNSSLGFTITQPLLRGFGIELNRRFIHIGNNNGKIADPVFQQQVIDTVAGMARLYTDLVSLNEDVKVKCEALLLAQRLCEDNKDKVDQGTLAPIEVTRAQAQVAVNQQDLISAEGLVEQQELIVKTAITRGGLGNPVIRAARIIPQ